MDSALNKVFGRDFVIGFFLPALYFLGGTFFIARLVWPSAVWLEIDWSNPFKGTGIFALITLVFAVFLQSINREIFRIIEGYGWGFLGSVFCWFHRRRFQRLEAKKEVLYSKPADLTDEEQKKFTSLSRTLAANYPSKEKLILPTSFGNAVRAYEDYSRVVYGFESIHGWARLQGLMSKEFRETLGGDRARVDLWLNLFVLTLLLALEVGAVGVFEKDYCALSFFPTILFVPLLLLAAWLAYLRARSSAQQFGEQVKAAFDIYLPALAEKLGYVLSSNPANNRKFWNAFNEVMVFRDREKLTGMAEVGLERASARADKPTKNLD